MNSERRTQSTERRTARNVLRSTFCILHSAFLLLFLSGCAYYNTFYNAEVLYQDGSKLVDANNRAGAKEKFEKAIKKSAAVIKSYPKSQWVDDALLLVAKSYYQLGDYTKAIVKFENFAAVFPDSKFRDEARFYHALSLIGDEQYPKGIQMLRDLSENSRTFREAATYQLAVTALKRQEYADANEALQSFVTKFPRSKKRQEAGQLQAEAYFHEGQYEQAIKAYSEHRRRAERSRDRALDDLRIAECYLLTNRPDSVLAIISRQGDRFPEYSDRINLLAGKAFLAKDKRNEAYASLAKVRSGAEGAEACLFIGKACEQDTNLAGAAAYYDSAKIRDPNSTYAQQATQRRLLIDRLTQLSKGTSDTAEARFLLAELFHLNLDQDTVALAQYQKVADSFPKSQFASKALYAIAWIRQHSMKAPDSLLAYQTVIDRYPKTIYAQAARGLLGQPLLPDNEIVKPPPPKRDTTGTPGGAMGDTLIAKRMRAESLAKSGSPAAESGKAQPPVAERRRERSRDRREHKPTQEESSLAHGVPPPLPDTGRRPPVKPSEPEKKSVVTPPGESLPGQSPVRPPVRTDTQPKPGVKPETTAVPPVKRDTAQRPGAKPAETVTRPIPGAETIAPPRPDTVKPGKEVVSKPDTLRTAPLPGDTMPHRVPISPTGTFRSDTNLKSVHFAFDRWRIRAQDTLILAADLEYLQSQIPNPKSKIQISGYCDPRGDEEYNDELGLRRAEAVKDWLVAHGLDPNHIQTFSYGKSAVQYDDPEQYWVERRCELQLRNGTANERK